MTTAIKLSLSDNVAALLDQQRGLMSRQEFISLAIIRELERRDTAEIDRLHATIRALTPRVSSEPPPAEEKLLSFD